MSKILRDEYGHGYYVGTFENEGETRHGVYKSKGNAGTSLNVSDAEKQARDYWGQDFKLVDKKAITGNPASFGDLLYKPDGSHLHIRIN